MGILFLSGTRAARGAANSRARDDHRHRAPRAQPRPLRRSQLCSCPQRRSLTTRSRTRKRLAAEAPRANRAMAVRGRIDAHRSCRARNLARINPLAMTGGGMPPRGFKKGTKRARQYEHVKESELRPGRSQALAKEISARTVNKDEHGRVSRGRLSTRGRGRAGHSRGRFEPAPAQSCNSHETHESPLAFRPGRAPSRSGSSRRSFTTLTWSRLRDPCRQC